MEYQEIIHTVQQIQTYPQTRTLTTTFLNAIEMARVSQIWQVAYIALEFG